MNMLQQVLFWVLWGSGSTAVSFMLSDISYGRQRFTDWPVFFVILAWSLTLGALVFSVLL
jgi:hypothetical protein